MTAASDVDLATSVSGLRLPNPVMVAAGCGGGGRELVPFLDVTALGALVTRTVRLDPRVGDPAPRLVETPSGLLGTHEAHGPGVDGFLAGDLPWLAQRRVRTVVSISARTLGEYAELAGRVGNSPGVVAVEVNLVADARDARPTDPVGGAAYEAGKVLGVVRRDVPRGVLVLAKLPGSLAGGVVDVASAVAEAGADGVVVAGGPHGLVLDPRTLRPTPGPGPATLSGPAIRPLALRQVWQVHEALPHLPVVGAGGIRTGYDALEFLAAGACAVQVGTAVVHDPSSPARIVEELRAELRQRGLAAVAEVTGQAHRPAPRPARRPEGTQP